MVGREGHIQPCYKEIRWELLPYDLYLSRYLSLLYKAPVCMLVRERRLLYHSGVKKKMYRKEKILDNTFVIRPSLGSPMSSLVTHSSICNVCFRVRVFWCSCTGCLSPTAFDCDICVLLLISQRPLIYIDGRAYL